MKAIIWLLVVVAIGWGAVYFFGGYGPFDPNAEGLAKKALIKPGMSHAEVFAMTNDPRKYQIINRHVQRIGGQELEYFEPSAPVNFDRARVDQHVKDGTLPHGFCCTFRFSERTAFTVNFDGAGKVTSVEDAVTMADLLDQR